MNTDYHYNHFEDSEKLHDVDLFITIAPFHETVVTIGLYDNTLGIAGNDQTFQSKLTAEKGAEIIALLRALQRFTKPVNLTINSPQTKIFVEHVIEQNVVSDWLRLDREYEEYPKLIQVFLKRHNYRFREMK